MILGFIGILQDLQVLGHFLLVYDRVMYSIGCYQMLFRKWECPSTRESTKIQIEIQ